MRFLLVLSCVALAAGAQTHSQFETVFPHGIAPRPSTGLALLDLDRDGRDEVLVFAERKVWRLDPETSAFRDMGVGTFSSGPATDLRFADFDRDGEVDLLLRPGPGTTGPLHLALHVGAPGAQGAFYPLWLPAEFAVVRGAALGDVDGDGDVDCAVGLVQSSGGTGVHVLEWTTSAVPAAGAAPPGTPAGLWVTLADHDNDGDLDLLGTRAIGAPVWLRNDGTGTFADASASLPPLAAGHLEHVDGDFDGDGFTDAALLRAGGAVELLWGGPAGFQPAAGPALPQAGRLLAADLDGDGDADLTGFTDRGFVVVRQGPGRTWTAGEVLVADLQMSAHGTGDLGGDGRADLVLCGIDGVLRTFHGGAPLIEAAGGNLGMRRPPQPETVGLPVFGDLDGDGRTDAVQPTATGFDVFRGLGLGAFSRAVLAAPGPGGAQGRSLLADFDGDGDLDLLRAIASGLHGFRNDGTGVFTAWFQQPVPLFLDHDPLRVGDVDRDGAADIVCAYQGGISVFRAVGAALVEQAVPLPPLFAIPTAIELSDWDGDGDPDLVTNARDATAFLLLANDGTGVFAVDPAGSLPSGQQFQVFAAVDVDGDRDADLFAKVGNGSLRLYQNDGRGGFTDVTATSLPTLTVNGRGGMAVGDFDQDGDPDLFLQAAAFGFAPLYLRNDTGRFVNVTTARWGPGPALFVNFLDPWWQVVAADVDDDGDVDLLTGASEVEVLAHNHLRQLATTRPPRPGAQFAVELFSGPGFGPPGFALLVASAGRLQASLALAGVAGRVEIDPAGAAVAAVSPMSMLGVSRTFLTLPNLPQLIGAELFLQGLVLPAGPQPFGVTNGVREVVVP